jgi:hypothetical protein
MGMGVTLEGVAANSAAAGYTNTVGGGFAAELNIETAPFGFGPAMGSYAGGLTGEYTWDEGDPGIALSKTDSSGWDLAFTVTKTISTSDDPATAGRASDLILGGGLELRFTQVTRVALDTSFENGVCLTSATSLVWEPSKVTTFLLPVNKIADEMRRIKANADEMLRKVTSPALEGEIYFNRTALSEQQVYLTQKYDDWVAVLDIYEGSSDRDELTNAKVRPTLL